MPKHLDELFTPAAVVDVDRMTANLRKMSDYVATHRLALFPHIKTHKTPELARLQLQNGAAGVTTATLREAEMMADVSSQLLLAYPTIGRVKLERLLALPEQVRTTTAVDSMDGLKALAGMAAQRGRVVGVLIEIDAGMRRVGVVRPEQAAALANTAQELKGVQYEGIMFYPGHVRAPVAQQRSDLDRLTKTVGEFLEVLERVNAKPPRVSGGSTPTAYASHEIEGLTEIRPGTYIFNDRTTALLDACSWDECAYSVLATVVSTAVPRQAVIDAGSKALSREELRGTDADGFGALLDRPDVVVKALSEEHGLLDLSETDWQPRVGERVRVIPNHVCVSVNLHERLWLARGDTIEASYAVSARGWAARA